MKLIITTLLLSLSSLLCGQNHTLTLNISNIGKSEGFIMVGLYTEEGFMDKPYKGQKLKAKKGNMSCTFTDIPTGKYAVAIFHDENSNGKQDRTLIGMPSEDWGLSTNPSIMRKPRFSDAVFELKSNKTLDIKMK